MPTIINSAPAIKTPWAHLLYLNSLCYLIFSEYEFIILALYDKIVIWNRAKPLHYDHNLK